MMYAYLADNKAINSDYFFLLESTCFCHLGNLYTSKFTVTLKTFSYPENILLSNSSTLPHKNT